MKRIHRTVFATFIPKGSVFGTACLAAALLTGQAAFAQVIEDYESKPAVSVENNSGDNATATVLEFPPNSGNHALRLAWKAHEGTHVAVYNSGESPILLDEPGTYVVTAKVNLEQCPSAITDIAIRVVDSGHETFQYSAPVKKAGEPGWTTLKWMINTRQPIVGNVKSWGDRVDGVMDFPVRFIGFGMGFKDWKSDAGSLIFDDITVTKIAD